MYFATIKAGGLALMLALVMHLGGGLLFAETALKPFVLAWKGQGALEEKTKEVRSKLTENGFEIVGSFSPYPTATILAITSDALKSGAAKSEFGGYGVAQRVSVTKVGEEIQVAYTNPIYMAKAYRMAVDLADVKSKLGEALGNGSAFGSEKGIPSDKLGKFHYMFGMEYFDEPSELAKYDSYSQATQAVEEGLAASRGGVSKVYRIDIPGKEESVFGVALTEECSGDEYIMSRIDFKEIRSTPHLPYEILVSKGEVYALFARYRIAINFPDLSMMGDHSFFSIMCAPGEIEDALEKVAEVKSG